MGAVLEDLLEEGIAGLGLAPIDEDKRGFEGRAKESLPTREGLDVVRRHPVLKAGQFRCTRWRSEQAWFVFGDSAWRWEASALDLGQEIDATAIKDEVEGLKGMVLLVTRSVFLDRGKMGGVWKERLPGFIDGDVRDPARPQEVLEGLFVMVPTLGHGSSIKQTT